MTRLVVAGDALLDRDWRGTADRLCADAPAPVFEHDGEEHVRPGGAALAATLAAGLGADVTLVTAIGADAAGRELRDALAAAGVRVVDLGLQGPTPEKIRLRATGSSVARIDRGCSSIAAVGEWNVEADEAVRDADAVLCADYGRDLLRLPALAVALQAADVPVVWDPHRRGTTPWPGTTVATPNLSEALAAVGRSRAGAAPSAGVHEVAPVAGELARRWGCSVVVTLGERGALLAGTPPVVVPATPVDGDVCGAGDAFASGLTYAIARGATVADAVAAGVAVAHDHVAGHGPAAPTAPTRLQPSGGVQLARSVRGRGGVVVAAGGCFDVLHAGHVRLLQDARRLGDCLVVLLNSDRSVRLLKGPTRPVNREHDRVAVLRGLACVDAVEVFDEADPRTALTRVQPHVFVKGGDYQGVALPEEATLSAWGGQVVLLPLLPGRSTTRILQWAERSATA